MVQFTISAAEEIRKTMGKVQPSSDPRETQTEVQQTIENAKAIAYSACTRTLETLNL